MIDRTMSEQGLALVVTEPPVVIAGCLIDGKLMEVVRCRRRR